MAGRLQTVGAGGGDARENGEAERAAHHEGGVDEPGGEPRLLRRDVAHRGEQHRVERDAGADAEQDHARQHVDDEAAADGRAREEREPGRREQEPDGERPLDAEAHDELRRDADARARP